jgi:hypothetical protein
MKKEEAQSQAEPAMVIMDALVDSDIEADE